MWQRFPRLPRNHSLQAEPDLEEESGLSPSKRERERARRRYAERLARRERAAQARRRQQIIAVAVIVGLALTGGVFLALNSSDSEAGPADVQTPPGDQGATQPDPGDEPGDDGNQEPLPTTDPQRYDSPPPPEVAEDRQWQVTITTNLGPINMTLDGQGHRRQWPISSSWHRTRSE